jgi:UDP-GlcNAc:undecaprenyl-phosphate GlcNAc-1-phosphate transferase
MWVHNPLTGIDIILGNWTYLLVPLWIVLMINVINWLDGVDGLASGVGLIASIILFILSISKEVNQVSTAILSIVLAGSLLGFLPFNFNPAKIFLGDIGSMFIGFMLAIFAIISGGKFATAALVLGLPILDALWVIASRLINHQVPWQADRRHLHHRLLDAGFSQRQSVLFLYAVSIFFGIIALQSGTHQKLIVFAWLVALMLILGLVTFTLRFKNRQKLS